ncbi:MAG: transposase family protein [Tannerella sp.]|jgi:hypothetical protein|nr:transposase family protein [Tannerella sp.]
MKSHVNYFSNLLDPRIERSNEHLLEDIVFITIAVVICGAETRNEMKDYGKAKKEWLNQYLRLPGGIARGFIH